MNDLVFNIDDNHLLVRLRRDGEALEDMASWKGELGWGFSSEKTLMMEWTSLLPILSPRAARALVEVVGSRFPVSPNFDELNEVSPRLAFRDSAPEWVFYGGSFNPWHEGHQACLNLLPEDKTCFILPDRNPFKEVTYLDPVISILEICNLIKYKRHQYLAPTFLLKQKKNPTVEWIEASRNRGAGKKFSLLLGYDSFEKLGAWTRSEDLLSQIQKLYVVSRLETEEERERSFEQFRSKYGVELEFLGRHEFEGVSSTRLRKQK